MFYMYSMTGFGKAEYKNGYELVVEIRSVNNRFLDLVPKYPKSFIIYDDLIRKTVQSKISRGRVELFFTFNDMRDNQKNIQPDINLAKAYYQAAVQISESLNLENDLTLSRIIRMPDVINNTPADIADEELKNIVKETLEKALDNLNTMRLTEGEKLKKELLIHVNEVESILARIEARAPLIAEAYRVKLEERIRNILSSVDYDQTRLLQEVAIFADKSNIDEEIARLKSHIVQYKQLIETDTPGRKVDFLIQEFNREANTICSKSNDVTITNDALLLKSEIEKIREQIQNIE